MARIHKECHTTSSQNRNTDKVNHTGTIHIDTLLESELFLLSEESISIFH